MTKTNNKNKLIFGLGNAKLEKTTAIFSLPAGWSCPGAQDCVAKVHRVTGKVTDGPHAKFRCYAAATEYMFPNVRKSRWNNWQALQACRTSESMADLICASIPKKANRVRIHQSGDFYNQMYFDAWLLVAQRNPGLIFYAYTKMLNFWVARRDSIPANLKLTASKGGRFDHLIAEYGLKCAEVVFSKAEAATKKLPLDHDDSHAWKQDKSFALLLHGSQQTGTAAAKALSQLRAGGVKGYSTDYFGHYAKKDLTTAQTVRA